MKKLLILICFIAFTIFALTLFMENKQNEADLEVQLFAKDFQKISLELFQILQDSTSPDFDKARNTLARAVDRLSKKYQIIKNNKKLISPDTQQKFDSALDDSYQKIVIEIPNKYQEKVKNSFEELEKAKRDFESDSTKINLEKRKAALENLQTAKNQQSKIQEILQIYQSIFLMEVKK